MALLFLPLNSYQILSISFKLRFINSSARRSHVLIRVIGSVVLNFSPLLDSLHLLSSPLLYSTTTNNITLILYYYYQVFTSPSPCKPLRYQRYKPPRPPHPSTSIPHPTSHNLPPICRRCIFFFSPLRCPSLFLQTRILHIACAEFCRRLDTQTPIYCPPNFQPLALGSLLFAPIPP